MIEANGTTIILVGHQGFWNDGKEKVPTICRNGGEIAEVGGDGKETRSFLTPINILRGHSIFTRSDFAGPVNGGSEEMVTIDGLVHFVLTVANKKLTEVGIEEPVGVHGRNSDNRMIREKINWLLRHLLRDGLQPADAEVLSQIEATRAVP